MYGEEIKFIKERLNPARLMFCVGWGGGEGRKQTKNLLLYSSLSCFIALCHQYVDILSLISAPKHKNTHCTAEAHFAVPFSKLSPHSHLSNAKYSPRPREMQTVKGRWPHMSAIPTAVHTAGTAAVRYSNLTAFVVTPHSKYSVD